MSMAFRTMRTDVVSDLVSLLVKLGYTQKSVCVDMTLTNAVNMPGTDLRRPLASSLWKSPGKKPEVDGVLLHEACPKLAVKFHPLTEPFD